MLRGFLTGSVRTPQKLSKLAISRRLHRCGRFSRQRVIPAGKCLLRSPWPASTPGIHWPVRTPKAFRSAVLAPVRPRKPDPCTWTPFPAGDVQHQRPSPIARSQWRGFLIRGSRPKNLVYLWILAIGFVGPRDTFLRLMRERRCPACQFPESRSEAGSEKSSVISNPWPNLLRKLGFCTPSSFVETVASLLATIAGLQTTGLGQCARHCHRHRSDRQRGVCGKRLPQGLSAVRSRCHSPRARATRTSGSQEANEQRRQGCENFATLPDPRSYRAMRSRAHINFKSHIEAVA
jgi:hypothetical protein